MNNSINDLNKTEKTKTGVFKNTIKEGRRLGADPEQSVRNLWRLGRWSGVVELATFDAGKDVLGFSKLRGPCAAYGTLESVLGPDGLLKKGAELGSSGLYITPALLEKGALYRAKHDEWVTAKTTAGEDDVVEASLLVLDIDVAPLKNGKPQKRKSNTNKVQWLTALQLGGEVRDWLVQSGCPTGAIGFGSSGNGCHVVLATSGTVSPELKGLRERLLLAAAKTWDRNIDETAYRIDPAMSDLGRFIPLYGSKKAKAADHKEMPQRRTWLVAPDDVESLDEAVLRGLVETLEGTLTPEIEKVWVGVPELKKQKTARKTKTECKGSGAWQEYYDAVSALDIGEVAAVFGLSLEECPNCGAKEGAGVRLMDETLTCRHQTEGCGSHKGGNYNATDLVRIMQGGGLNYRDLDARKKATDAIAEKFGIKKPRGRRPKEAVIPTDVELISRAYGGLDIEAEYCGDVDVEAALGEGVEVEDDEGAESFRALTDLGNAYRVMDKHGDDVIRVAGAEWYRWMMDGWGLLSKDETLGLVAGVMERIGLEAARATTEAEKAALAGWAERSQGRRYISDAEVLARSKAKGIAASELDADGWLLSCQNGVLELKTGKFREHKREDLITKHTACDYDPDAKAPLFKKTLEWAQPDPKVRAYLYRKWGYSMTGVVREHNFDTHIGSGGNGKGTILHTIRQMMGDYGVLLPMDALVADKNDNHPVTLADLPGSRFVLASEANEGQMWDEALLRRLSGGDGNKFRGMREKYEEQEQTWHIDSMMNVEMRLKGVDDATRRRINQIPWDSVMRNDDPNIDRALPQKLLKELPGILNLCLIGCLDWQEQGLNPPDSIKASTAEYFEDNDLTGQYLGDMYDVSDPTASEPFKEVYADYVAWMKERGRHPVGAQRLGRDLKKRGYASCREGKRNVNCRKGLRKLRATDAVDDMSGDELDRILIAEVLGKTIRSFVESQIRRAPGSTDKCITACDICERCGEWVGRMVGWSDMEPLLNQMGVGTTSQRGDVVVRAGVEWPQLN